MAMTGAEDFADLDLTSDLADGMDNTGVPQGSEGTTNTPDGAIITEQVQTDHKPRETTLRDQLSNAFKPVDETKPAPTETSRIALTADAEGRYRRSDGTFASVDEIKTFTDTAQTAVPVESIVAQLPAAVAEEFKSLPAKSQEFLASTMEDLNNRATRYSEYDQLETLIGPRRQAWAQNGMNPVVAVNQLFQLSDFAGTNPGEFVLWFADNNQIDLDALLDARDAAQQEVTPEVLELRGQVQHLSQTVAQITQGQQAQPQNDNLQVVQSFASEKDEAGNLKRPYLADVSGDLAVHVTAVRNAFPNMAPSDVLAKAYENACWANPQVRLKLQTDMDAQRRDAARQKANAAKAATSSISGGPNGSGGNSAMPPASNLSLRDTLKAAFDAQL